MKLLATFFKPEQSRLTEMLLIKFHKDASLSINSEKSYKFCPWDGALLKGTSKDGF